MARWMASSAFAIVAESHPAIVTCGRPPRPHLPGSGLPAAVPAPRDPTRCPPLRWPGRAGPKRGMSRRIYRPAGCPDCILGTACPPPRLRPSQSAPGFKPNGAKARMSRKSYASSPQRATEMALRPGPPSQDLPPSRAQAGTRRRRSRHTGCMSRPWIAQPARSPSPGRVASRQACGASEFAVRRPGGVASRS